MPFFSIVIPTYNRAIFIKNAIQSVQNQLYSDWELLVIDDGSTDNTAEVVAQFVREDTRIKYIYQPNQERSVARNNGIAQAQGTYICFLDSDDYYLPTHLEALHRGIGEAAHKVAFFYTGLLHQLPNQPPKAVAMPQTVLPNGVEHLLQFTVFPTVACLHKRIFEQHKFEKNLSHWEDTALWVQIASQYPVIQINEYTAVWCVHNQSTTHIFEKTFDLAQTKAQMNVKKRILELASLQPFLTSKIKNEFFSQCYAYYFYDSFLQKKPFYMLYFYAKIMWHTPLFLFSKIGIVDLLNIGKCFFGRG